MAGQRGGKHARQRLYPEARPSEGAHTGDMSRASHAQPGFSLRRPNDGEEMQSYIGPGDIGHSHSMWPELCRPMASGTPPLFRGSWWGGGVTDGGVVSNKIVDMDIIGGADSALIVWIATTVNGGAGVTATGVTYWADQTGGSSGIMTQIGTTLSIGKARLSCWRLDAPGAAGVGSHRAKVVFSQSGGTNDGFEMVAVEVGGASLPLTYAYGTSSDAGTSISTPIADVASGWLLLSAVGISTSNSPFSSNPIMGTPSAPLTQDQSNQSNAVGLAVGHMDAATGPNAPAWTGWGSTGGYYSGLLGFVVGVFGALGTEGDALAELVGEGDRASRCGHRHHLIRTRAPGVTDDIAHGIPEGTAWINTVTGNFYVSTDETIGAAVWLLTATTNHDSLSGVSADDHHTENHQARHNLGGADALKLDDLSTPDDNTDLNASTSRHGLLRKLSNVAAQYLDGTGAWSTPAGSGGGGGGSSPEIATRVTFSGTPASPVSWASPSRDDGGFYLAGSPTRLTAPRTGWYTVLAEQWITVTNTDSILPSIRLNGSTDIGKARDYETTDGIGRMVQVHAFYYLTAGDYVELTVSAAEAGDYWMSMHGGGVSAAPTVIVGQMTGADYDPGTSFSNAKVNLTSVIAAQGITADTANDRLTALVAGWYFVRAHMGLLGNGEVIAEVYKNGSSLATSSKNTADSESFFVGGSAVALVYLAVGDYVELWACYQGSGGYTGIVLEIMGVGGAAGPQGPSGPPGIDGEDGEAGPQGPPGPTGAAGVGSVGATGPRGLQGPPGDDGIDGVDGDRGPQGATGAAGPAGSPGATGATGPMGLPGIDGEDGLDGMPGPQGPQGVAGTAGAAGVRGLQGMPGFDGEDGSDGERGPAGPAGAPGSTGSTGPMGPVGPMGIMGMMGEDGEPGEMGFPGNTGPVGPAGGGGGGLTLTTFEVTLMNAPNARRSGHTQITGTGFVVGKRVLVIQAEGPYTGKGTRADEAEMDALQLRAVVTSSTIIDVYWSSQYKVRGTYKLAYAVSA